MKIIRHGYFKKSPFTFVCHECGCIFEIDTEEAKDVIPLTWSDLYNFDCPDCNVHCSYYRPITNPRT